MNRSESRGGSPSQKSVSRMRLRAPDPTQASGKKGVSTVNVRRKQKSQDLSKLGSGSVARNSMRDVMKTLGRKKKRLSLADETFGIESMKKKSESRKKLTISRNKKKGYKGSLLAKTSRSVSDSTTESSFSNENLRTSRTMSMKSTLPRRMGNFLAGLYRSRTKPPIVEKDVDKEVERYEEELTGLAGLGSEDKRFQQAIMEKYQSMSGSLGKFGVTAPQESAQMQRRKESSFSMGFPMVLLLGKSKAGKSTLFKQLLTMAGEPPSYARAYKSTTTPKEKDVTIEDTDLTLVDVGGSKRDIVDWRFYLTSAEVIVFVVALDEFDREVEDNGKKISALQESLELFDSIVNNVALLNSKFVLILNKEDRFRKKLVDKRKNLAATGYFENAPESFEVDENIEFIRELFLEKAEMSEHDVQVEVTSAIDQDECSGVLTRLTERLIKSKDVTKWKNLL